jgi:hypothetical protein
MGWSVRVKVQLANDGQAAARERSVYHIRSRRRRYLPANPLVLQCKCNSVQRGGGSALLFSDSKAAAGAGVHVVAHCALAGDLSCVVACYVYEEAAGCVFETGVLASVPNKECG